MSDDLFYTRLRWSSGHGIAKYKGRVTELTQAPEIAGFPVAELIHTPEVHSSWVRFFGTPWRELLPEEIIACDEILRATEKQGEP